MSQNSIKIAGVIAEFNPFHDGHAYLLKKAREVTGADFVVVVMSGNFVQRGTPAIMEKFLRVRAALTHGADAVFELPVRAATGSADYFAEGAVWLLSALGVTDLCFGCEMDDLSALEQLADVLAEEPEPFREALKGGLKDGLSYAAAVQRAMEEYLKYASRISPEHGFQKDRAPGRNQDSQFRSPDFLKGSETDSAIKRADFSEKEYADFSYMLSLPNTLLAISYLKALRRQNSSIRPHAILRRGSAYHSVDPVPVSEALPSAAALRKLMGETCSSGINHADIGHPDLSVSSGSRSDMNISNKRRSDMDVSNTGLSGREAFTTLKPYFSRGLYSLYQPAFGQAFPVFTDDFSLLLGKTLLDLKPDVAYFDCAPDLYRRIYNNRRSFTSFDDFCQKIHTKQFSLASAQRGVLHCMLDLKAGSKEDLYAAYLPLLGFRRSSEACLSEISQRSPLSLSSEAGWHSPFSPSSEARQCSSPSPSSEARQRSTVSVLSEINRRSPLPLLSKTCEGRNLADPQAVRQWKEIMHADALYRLVRCCRFGKEFPVPEQEQIIVV